MNEALRLDYLHAMGIASYVPRFELEGAAPSPLCDLNLVVADVPATTPANDYNEESNREEHATETGHFDSDAEYQQMAEAAERNNRDASNAPLSAGSRLASTMQELGLASSAQAGQNPAAATEQIVGDGAQAAAANPEFTVELVATGIGLLMIVDTTAGPPSPAEKRLMANIAVAVSRHHKLAKAPEFATSRFKWPVLKAPGLSLGRDAAKEALQANIMAQAERQQAHCVILFGSSLQPFIDVATLQTAAVQLLYAAEPAAMLSDGSLKAPLWQNLRKVLFSS
ncbi:MAG: hypothetical protein P1U47_07505 [Zhongshania sp.]|uniref:hypothetical protein n=1 Tax=Zhongshania sp. TaxID=1971902 RepID=UPI00260FCD34|nr:hypothetical protein [Zhongshania sp.]MDF1692201.1 hypothetical protein [Zhongshania sp.]